MLSHERGELHFFTQVEGTTRSCSRIDEEKNEVLE